MMVSIVPVHLTAPTRPRLEEWAAVTSHSNLISSFHCISGRISLRSLVRLWFAPSSEVHIYRQLVTQVVLAILSGDLRPGERLPSTRVAIGGSSFMLGCRRG